MGNSLYYRCRARLEDLGVRLGSRTVCFSVLPEVHHAFTHFKAVYRRTLVVGARSWEAEGIRSDGPEPSEKLVPEEHVWVMPDQVEHLPLPVAQRKILDLARGALARAALAAPAPTH